MTRVIDSSGSIVAGHGCAPDRPEITKPSIELRSSIGGQPHQILLTKAQAVDLLTQGVERWLTPSERADIIANFIR